MSRRRLMRLALVAAILVVAALAWQGRPPTEAVLGGSPGKPLPVPDFAGTIDPGGLVTLRFVNRAGKPAKVTLAGTGNGASVRITSELTDGGISNSKVSGPFTVADLTVEVGGGSAVRLSPTRAFARGERHDLIIRPDGTAEFASAP